MIIIKDHNELHEIKKSRSIEKAGIWQVKYYLYYLEKRGVSNLKAKIDYPSIKKTLVVELSDSDKTELDSILKDIDIIARGEFPPAFEEKKICNKCAYHDLCFI